MVKVVSKHVEVIFVPGGLVQGGVIVLVVLGETLHHTSPLHGHTDVGQHDIGTSGKVS